MATLNCNQWCFFTVVDDLDELTFSFAVLNLILELQKFELAVHL